MCEYDDQDYTLVEDDRRAAVRGLAADFYRRRWRLDP